ncbi:MAG: hypothetical protein M1482_02580 [Chloroflexi bacterium]|nr:hypothetical protein [Chloroflexota bacterium]
MLRTQRIARGLVVLLLALAALYGSSSLLEAEPRGTSPFDGREVTCSVESVAAGGMTWFRVPYDPAMGLELDLTAIDGVYFEVFAPDQVVDWPTLGEPMGQSEPDAEGTAHQQTWQGRLTQADNLILDYYYVRLTNTIGIEAKYRLCSKGIKADVPDPSGDSPADGLTAPSCAYESADAGSEVWHKVPYHSGKELELYLIAASPDVGFDVFTPDQVRYWPTMDQPIGRGTRNPNEPDYAATWKGHLTKSDYYYVRVTNTSGVTVPYQLCTQESKIPGPPETPTPGYPLPTGQPQPKRGR